MTDQANQPTMTVHFARKVKPAEYEMMEASIFISDTIAEGADLDELARDLFLQARSAVYEQLDIDFSINERKVAEEDRPPQSTAEAVQNVQQGLPGSQVVPGPTPAPVAPQAAPQPVPGGAPAAMAASAQATQAGYAEHPRCPQCGGETYDNTAENNFYRTAPNPQGGVGFKLTPDFKCKNDQCGKAIWPPDYEDYKGMPRWNRKTMGQPWRG